MSVGSGDRSGLSLRFAGTGVAGFSRSGALNLFLSLVTIEVVSIRLVGGGDG